jgi:hypothetical protein
MQTLQRPSKREIDKRITLAKQALSQNKGYFANPLKSMGEINALELDGAEELWPLLLLLLEEIELGDYAGTHPPMKAYEPAVSKCELFAFAWHSARMGRSMYLKFAMKGENFYLVSIHTNAPQRGGGQL